ncbi:hypothetical protein BDF14DRAFT_1739574 [Spinellus fusiger]|nr:hypothetical protein BDF14DRAFT_1739574 [Spinellus fusiger]
MPKVSPHPQQKDSIPLPPFPPLPAAPLPSESTTKTVTLDILAEERNESVKDDASSSAAAAASASEEDTLAWKPPATYSFTDKLKHKWNDKKTGLNKSMSLNALSLSPSFLMLSDPGRQKLSVRFCKTVSVHHAYSKYEYDRGSDPEAACTHLSADLALRIKEELNDYKQYEMQVHESSRVFTHLFPI